MIGVVQVISKKDHELVGFTKADEDCLHVFAVCCALAHCQIYSQVQLKSAQYEVAMQQVCYLVVCSNDEFHELRSKERLDNPPPNIDHF